MRLRACFGASFFVLLAACSGASEEIGSGTADLTESSSTGLERALTPDVPVPAIPELGQRLDTVVGQQTAGYTASAPTTNDDCTVTRFQAADGRIAKRERCVRTTGMISYDMLRFYEPGDLLPFKVFADHNLDGAVDAIRNEAGPIVDARDEDFDGRVDYLSETVESLGGSVDLTAYGAGWRLDTGMVFANRTREDSDKNGRFDREGVTARDPDHQRVAFFRRLVD